MPGEGNSPPSLNVMSMMGVGDTNPKKVELGSVGAVNWKVSPLSSESVAVKEGTALYWLEKSAPKARAPLAKWMLSGM